MDALIGFFEFIVNAITSIWDLVTGIISNLLMLFEYLGVVTQICYSSIASMPSWLRSFCTITIIVLVLYIVLGRNAGGGGE